jgi:hypothetical protein
MNAVTTRHRLWCPTLFATILTVLLGFKSASLLAATGFEYIGQQIIPNGLKFGNTTVGGLSSIDYDSAEKRYFVLSDDRSKSRFYTLKLDLDKFDRSGEAGMAGVRIEAVTTLRSQDGGIYSKNKADPEGLRLSPDRKTLYWSDEGKRSYFGFRDPAVTEATLGGNFVRELSIPNHFKPKGSASGESSGDSGIYDNLSLESLAVTPSGKTLWTAAENGLTQDSRNADLKHGSLTRLLSFNIASGKAGSEYIYEIEPVALPPLLPGLFATNGLSDMLAIGEKQFIMLERSFAIGAATPGTRPSGVTIRLFYADASRATDVSSMPSIAGKDIRKVEKTLLLDLSSLLNDDATPLVADNIEGLTFGPCYKGKPTLILVSDNNFSPMQFTQIVALSVYDPLPLPIALCNKAD